MRARPLVVVSLLVLSSLARADETSDARAHYDKGTALYDLGHYEDAAREYEEAFKLKPSSALLFNIGQAHRLGGNDVAALRAYRGYLRREPDATNRTEIEGYMARLEQSIATKKPVVAPEPAPPPPAPKATPVPSPAPAAAPSPAPAPVNTDAATTVITTPHAAPGAHTPAYEKWWVWTIVGVAAAGVAVGLGVGLTQPRDVTIPAGAHTVQW